MAKGVVIGLDNVLANLNREVLAIKGRTIQGITAAAVHLSAESAKLTPVVTSNLRNSRYVISPKGAPHRVGGNFKEPGKKDAAAAHADVLTARSVEIAKWVRTEFPRAEVGYSAVYAGAAHENPRTGKTGGVSPSGIEYKPPKGSKRQIYSTVGQWKFLEDAVKRNTKKILSIIRDFARIKK